MKTTKISEVSASKTFGIDNDEVVGGSSSVTDEMIENLSKSRKLKQFTKWSRSSQRVAQTLMK